MTFSERLKVHADIERRNRAKFDLWRRGITVKRKAKNRVWGAVRCERGRVA